MTSSSLLEVGIEGLRGKCSAPLATVVRIMFCPQCTYVDVSAMCGLATVRVEGVRRKLPFAPAFDHAPIRLSPPRDAQHIGNDM